MLSCSTKCRWRFLLTFLCIWTFQQGIGSSCSFGQEEIVESIGGASIANAREQLSAIVKLKISNGRISLLRNWDAILDRRPKMSEAERVQQQIDKMLDRGFPEDVARRHAKAMVQHGMGRDHEAAVTTLFREMCESLGARSGGGAGNRDSFRFNYRGNGQLYGLRGEKNSLTLQLKDTGAGGADLELHDDEKVFQFRLIQGASVVIFRQAKKCRLVVVHEDLAEVLEADDFSMLEKKYPAQVKRLLKPIWRKIGFAGPFGFENKKVVEAGLELLTRYYDDKEKVQRMIADVEGDSKSKTEAALVQLKENYPFWQQRIEKLLENRNPETRKLVAKAVRSSTFSPVQDYLDSVDLLDSPESLVALLENTDRKEVVVRRLKEISGVDFDDEMEWSVWLQNRNQEKKEEAQKVDRN